MCVLTFSQLRLHQKLEEFKLKMPWVERLDLTTELTTLTPEQTLQMEKYQQKRANLFAGNAKIKSFAPNEDPVLNDFQREMTFHRQAQAAVIDGMQRLHALKIPTKRPDDYFAEMAKSDEHMQKIRSNLMAKQEGQAKSERIKQIRDQRKMGKIIQRQARVQRESEKRDMLDNLKKYRKKQLKDLDFLEDDNKQKKKGVGGKDKRKARDNRFGFGGKKRDSKRNTKDSSMDVGNGKKRAPGGRASGGKAPGGRAPGGRPNVNKNNTKGKRLGKDKRTKVKSKGRR